MLKIILPIMLLLLCGCVLMPESFVTPAEILYEKTVTETTNEDGKITKTTQEKTKTSGPGYRGANAKDMSFTAPLLQFGDWMAQAGSLAFTGFNLSAVSSMQWVYLFGAACIVGGIVVAWLLSKGLGVMIVLGGISIFAVARLFEQYPWVAFLPVGIAIMAGITVVIELRRGKASNLSLQTVVQAVEDVSRDAQEEIKAKVEKYAGKNKKQVKATITNVKQSI